MMRSIAIACALVCAGAIRAAAQAPPPAADACVALAALQLPGVALSEARSQRVAAGSAPAPAPGAPPGPALPAHCRFDAVIDRRSGLDGKRYGIGFAVALPDDWNGRLLMQGGGGLNGRVAPPVGGVAAGDKPALARGFAVVTTDTGHEGAGFDASFMRDQQAALDFAYVAVGRVALAAKDVVARYYGRPASKSYFAGCSTGGREAMLMTQRYPAYFDGVVSGDPAMRTGFSRLGNNWRNVAFNQAAPKDSAGRPEPHKLFSDADRKVLVGGLMNACDANDGIKDGMIFHPEACKFDPATLACNGSQTSSCL